MIKRRGFPRIFFGWWSDLITSTWSGLGHGFYGFGISVFFKPLAADLGLTRAATAVAVGIGRLEGGLESPLTGWLSDKFGPRWVIFTGTFVVGIGLILMNFINSLWAFYLVWGVTIGFGLNLAHTIAADKILTNWFVRKRGLAFSLRFVLIGITGVITLPIVTWLVATQGWRTTNLIWAVVMLAGLPFLWFFIKQKRPEYYGLLPDGATVEGEAADTSQMIERGVKYAAEFEEVEFTIRQAVRTRGYWLLISAWAGSHLIFGAVTPHLVPFLTDRGIDPIAAGNMMAMMIFFTIPSRFLGGFLADRVRKGHLRFFLSGTYLILIAGITAVILKQTIATIYVFLILFGFGSGASTPLQLIVTSRYFGRKAFATIQGSIFVFAAPGAFLAPIYAGWIYDTTGSYIPAFATFTALGLVAASLICLARPPQPPAEITDVRKFM